MICIILVAGVGNSLEKELLHDETLRGVPRALLPVGGRPMLSYWWESVVQTREILSVYLVTNAINFKHFERWATANGLPTSNVVNNGASSAETSLGAARDLQLGLRRAEADGISVSEACVIAGDSLFFREFDLPQVINCFRRLQRKAVRRSIDAGTAEEDEDDGADSDCGSRAARSAHQVSLVLYYKMAPSEDCSKRGLVDIDPVTKRVTSFHEKPKGVLSSDATFACPLFYILGKDALDELHSFVDGQQEVGALGPHKVSCGRFLEVSHARTNFYGLRLPGGFNLVGVSAGLEEYRALNASFQGATETGPGRDSVTAQRAAQAPQPPPPPAESRAAAEPLPPATVPVHAVLSLPKSSHGKAFARVGMLGNPSDGFFGKTVSMTISNFYAQVWITESEKLCIKPHPLFDPNEFGSLNDLYSIAVREGYHGGMRLLMGTCKKFYEFALENNIALPHRNFTVSYDTNIPRQVGLSGSSAIVTALFRALMSFYGLTEDDIPKPLQPTFVLSVEMEEMGIQAGLQDRVVQCYEGIVYMDFERAFMAEHNHGRYTRLPDHAFTERFFIAYRSEPSDSGKIHSNVKQRWLDGDEAILEGMSTFASFAEEGKDALLRGDLDAFGALMDRNFALRRELYSDAVVGAANLEMIAIAKRYGASAKFPGSGGAILGLARAREDFAALRRDFEDAGCVFCVLEPAF